jgi:hypothetical protein
VSSCRYRRGDALRKEFSDAADLGANAPQFFFDALVAPVNVVYAVNNGFAFGNERG